VKIAPYRIRGRLQLSTRSASRRANRAAGAPSTKVMVEGYSHIEHLLRLQIAVDESGFGVMPPTVIIKVGGAIGMPQPPLGPNIPILRETA
jgi:hypothetical protein